MLKFWLSVSDEEQRRFKAREAQAKANHSRRLAKTVKMASSTRPAVCDMIDRTSTENAG